MRVIGLLMQAGSFLAPPPSPDQPICVATGCLRRLRRDAPAGAYCSVCAVVEQLRRDCLNLSRECSAIEAIESIVPALSTLARAAHLDEALEDGQLSQYITDRNAHQPIVTHPPP